MSFFKPPAPSALEVAKRGNSLLSLLYGASGNLVNAPSTLPIPLIPRKQLFREVAETSGKTGPLLKFAQYWGFGKLLLKFYKEGIVNVWQNYRLVSKWQHEYSLSTVDRSAKTKKIVVSNFTKLTEEMATVIYESKSETKLFADPELFTLSRTQYQTISRTRKDIWKLPLFAVLFVIFEETTPLLCYVVPEVTPTTCVLPQFLPKLWGFPKNAEALAKLKQESYPTEQEKIIGLMQTAYSLPQAELIEVCRVLRLTSRLIPGSWYPPLTLRNRLQNYYNYLVVDNYYLSGKNSNGTVFDLGYEELLRTCLERHLIRDIKPIEEIAKIDDPVKRAEAEEEMKKELQQRLIRFIVDLETFNVGLIGM